MTKFRNLTLVLLMQSILSYAGTVGTLKPVGEVTMPCANYGWDFTIGALYLKTTNFDYLAPFEVDDEYNELPPRWGWGFIIGGSYHYTLGSDIVIEWYHYGRTTEQPVITATSTVPSQILYTEFRPKWDAVNLEFGQTIVLSDRHFMRFHAGGQFSRISHDLYVNNGTLPLPDAIHNSMNGFGGRIGMDVHYNLSHQISAYVQNAFAVLYGKPEFHTLTSGIIDSTGITQFSKNGIVPEFEAKIGSRFTFPWPQGDLNIDVGYMANRYFEALLYRTIRAETQLVDFSLYGPYLRVNYIGYI